MAMSRYEALARRLMLVLGLGAGTVACGANGPLSNDPPAVAAPAPATQTGPNTAMETSPPSETAPPVAPTPPPVAPTPPPASDPAPTTPPPAAPSPALATLEAEADALLAHLRALQIVEVRDLVLHLPDASSICYGPCSADAWDLIVTDEYRRQVPRLRALSGLADGAINGSYPVPITTTAAPKDVATLNELAIVNLGALLVAQPANNPLCYNTPCPEDVQKAAKNTGLRAFYLRTWASRAHDRGKL